MRSRPITVFFLTAGLLIAAGPILAQGNPSADSIINSLRPGAGMTGGTRGIRPVGPSESPPSAVAPAAMPRAGATAARTHGVAGPRAPSVAGTNAQPAAQAPSVDLTVQFANNSAILTPAAMHTLDELGRALSSQTLATFRFRIEGHTDSLGSHDHNQALSEQRAQAVVNYLVTKFHVEPSRLEAVGMGETQPLVPARANAPEPRNRRVTVVNLGA